MSLNHNQPHYAPSSVGGLMDPAFLRGAMSDAQGYRADGAGNSVTWLRFRQAMLAAVRWRRGRQVAQ